MTDADEWLVKTHPSNSHHTVLHREGCHFLEWANDVRRASEQEIELLDVCPNCDSEAEFGGSVPTFDHLEALKDAAKEAADD